MQHSHNVTMNVGIPRPKPIPKAILSGVVYLGALIDVDVGSERLVAKLADGSTELRSCSVRVSKEF
jgi:hypothetical protein